MDSLRGLGWYARIKTGPSPEDNALLELTRELSVQFQVAYWYKLIVWGMLDRHNSIGWMISRPTNSAEENAAFPGSLPMAELMLPEFLKGRLSIDDWRALIALHMVRFKTYKRRRMNRLIEKIAIVPRSLFFLLLFYIPAAALGGLSGPVLYFPSPIFLLAALWIRRSLRKSLKVREFELDATVAKQVGPQQVSQVLERVETFEQKRVPSGVQVSLQPFVAYWNPSVKERVEELTDPRRIDLPKASGIPKIGLRGRVIVTFAGFTIFWGSGLVAGNIYARGQATFVCTDNTCAALVVIAAVGFWIAIIGGISILIAIARRFL